MFDIKERSITVHCRGSGYYDASSNQGRLDTVEGCILI